MKSVIKTKKNSLFKWLFALAVALVLSLSFCLFTTNSGAAFTASAATVNPSDYSMEIRSYDVGITVRKDRKIEFTERIEMYANTRGSRFKRNLPLEKSRYYDITAKCESYDGFEYSVYTGEDDYLVINCYAPTSSGSGRTFEFSYTMEIGQDDVQNGMRLDVIGYGWTVPLQNVKVTMNFPDTPTKYTVTVGGYGVSEGAGTEKLAEQTLSDDGKTLTLRADLLEPVYNNVYNETTAEGITVMFAFEPGVLENFTKTRILTDDMWKFLLGGGICVVAAALLLIFTRKKRDMVTVVNIKAPDDMDPLKMGLILDGNVDNDDLTSMIYYFAHKGWLKINLDNQEDPTLISLVPELPDDAPAYQQTLFNGLFLAGTGVGAQAEGYVSVKVSQLVNRFYEQAKVAKMQIEKPHPMYETKSVLGYLGGCVLGILFAFLSCFLMGRKIGGGYTYYWGGLFALPIIGIGVIGYIRENYRYKWKKTKRGLLLAAEIAIAALTSGGFMLLGAEHLMTGWEKLAVCLFAFLPVFVTSPALSRTEKYTEILGEILGFKDFIIVTEEEKIKFMLQENPELYYKILPYAQVLGVTDVWEEKFKRITVEPPVWCTGTNGTVFNYVIISHCMNRAIADALRREAAAKAAKAGSYVGRSGGGGRFGGFGGGGHGGGGGSWS